MPLSFSVTIPNYNHGKLLTESLDSIERQSIQPDEIIILDDASTDDSVSIIENLAKNNNKIVFLQNSSNLGCVRSVCKAIKSSSCNYFCDLGADDPIRPGLFEKSMNLFSKYPHAALSCTDFSTINPEGEINHGSVALHHSPCFLSPAKLAEKLHERSRFSISTSTAIYNKPHFIEAGGFSEPILEWHHDWFIAHVSAFRNGLCYIPESLQYVNIDPNSFSRGGMKNYLQQKNILKNILKFLNSSQYADVLPFFKIPSVLSKFGFKLLNVIIADSAFHHFLSPSFVEFAVTHGEYLSIDSSQHNLKLLSQNNIVEKTRELLRSYAVSYIKIADKYYEMENFESAKHSYFKAMEADTNCAVAEEKYNALS